MTRRTTRRCCFACCVWALANSVLYAQQSSEPAVEEQTEPAAAAAADHAALREMASVYEQTITAGKPEMLKPYLASDFTGVMITADEVSSFQSLDEYWQKIQGLLGKGGTYRVKVNIPQPAQIVGDVAFAHGTTDDVAITSAGKEYKFTGRWTAICRKDGGTWKIVRIHGSMDPIANTFVAAALKGASVSAATLAGIIGLIVGIALTLLTRRNRGAATHSHG